MRLDSTPVFNEVRRHARRLRTLAVVASLAVVAALFAPLFTPAPATAAPGPVGAGFTVTAGDLQYILQQIKISERHANTLTASNPCGTLVGSGPNQIPDRLTPYGLRTVDGSCNNLFTGRHRWGAADELFPRLTQPKFRSAEGAAAGELFPGSPPIASSSFNSSGTMVVESRTRTISNLIVDQTSTNPAAVAAAGFPVRSQNNPGLFPCTTDPDPTADPPVEGVPAGCVPTGDTLFIPNVTTDVGLSPPYNSMFTFFGQFFDHGVDQTVKGGGVIFIPLKADDPLRTLGPDGRPHTGDELGSGPAFMPMTRTQDQPGGVKEAENTDSPWVDQSQTYTSHASHQVFVREYDLDQPGPDGILHDDLTTPGVDESADNTGVPEATGRLLGGLDVGETYTDSPDGRTGMATWASTKKQAAEELGLLLQDKDVTNIPALLTDPYGQFIPGPNGLPQYLLTDGTTLEGDLANPVPVPANAVHFDTPFLTDIAHNADPSPRDTDGNGSPETVPTPDPNDTPGLQLDQMPADQYDDELLDAHFIAGDGRVNENIALTFVHQIFHSEHDRLVADIDATLHQPGNETLLAGFESTSPVAGSGAGARVWSYGDRLFQAARFVTEMEYQHLVFEEFGRKLVPAIHPFHVYSPDVNPAIDAEFAHAVYRFGHSMLDDDVARKLNGTDNSVPLLDAFLNPPEYFDSGTPTPYTPEQAAGAVAMGSADQIGNELDEFVTRTLRSNLLGLPLDLAAINMTRARDAGIPPLNDVRRQLFAQTGDGALRPYDSWADFGQHLKHPESLINFVAAYGTHPSITGGLAARRDAARAIVDPRDAQPGPDGVFGTDCGTPAATAACADDVPADVRPRDADAFLFSTLDTGPDGEPGGGDDVDWRNNANGVTTTGLDEVDLWVGGLAEVTNLNGGLLGSTFNYVFQTQMEKLQDNDRFYYLNRTPGMNLRTQLESNSFTEMIQRNTDGTTALKADAFGTADCEFMLDNLAGTPAGFNQFGSIVNDDPTTECNERLLLQRMPDGTIQYKARNTVDPPGINGQSIYEGTTGVDRVNGGNDNDTFWGDLGDDFIEGNGGDDVVLGGLGNDHVTDLDGADVLKGGPGNDAIDSGPGDDINLGGDGKDLLTGGLNDNESFGGEGDDFVIAGNGADAVFGDGGDDWIQGGNGQDLLIGDHGAPFFDDPAEFKPGNDVFIGQPGENDYDTEGGDDLMSQNAAIDRNAGAGGFDWAFHQYDTVGADDDMKINQLLAGQPLPVVVNRDRWQETEADSGSAFNDTLRGDDMERIVGGFGFSGCDALDPTGVARVNGLDRYVTSFPTPLADVVAVSPLGRCPLTAAPNGGVWAEGNILLGGGGSDLIEGRSNADIIDGDTALNVRISVRVNPSDAASEIGSTDLLEKPYQTGNTHTLQQDLMAGNVTIGSGAAANVLDPSNLVVVREIRTPGGQNLGTSAALGRANDCPTRNATDLTVHVGAAGNCDTALYEVPSPGYRLEFNAAGPGSIRVVDLADEALIAGGTPFPKGDGIDTLWNVDNLRFCQVHDPVTDACTQARDVVIPNAPTLTSVVAGNASAVVNFAPGATNGSTVTSFRVEALRANGTVAATATAAATATTATVTGLTNGTTYTFRVIAVDPGVIEINGEADPDVESPPSNESVPVTPQVPPAPSVISSAPTNGSGGASTTGNIVVTFDQPILASSITNATVVLTISGQTTSIGRAVSLSADGMTLTVDPTPTLAFGTTYRLALNGTVPGSNAGLRNAAGQRLVNTAISFTTRTATAPFVVSSVPTNAATGVNVADNLTVTFNEPVTGVVSSTVVLTVDGQTTTLGRAASMSGNTLTVDPNQLLAAGTTYRLSLNGTVSGSTAGLRNADGVRLANTSITFTTTADSTAPTITAINPAAGATGVARTPTVRVDTSERVVGVATDTFEIRNAATNALVTATLGNNAAGTRWTLTPGAALAPLTTYRVTMTGGPTAVRDVAGNPLTTFTWTFTTR
jgi:Ca2+-binding RTX toxin-like protein